MAVAAPSTSGISHSTDPSKPSSGAAVPFRAIIPDPAHPRIAGIANHDALSWCESRRQIAAPAWLINRLDKKSLEKPYKGFTVDGTVQEEIHNYAEDEGALTEEVVVNIEALLSMLPEEAKKQVKCGEVEDDDFRLWSNPELYVNPGRPSQYINMIFCLYSRQ
jgi:hypothetical protein